MKNYKSIYQVLDSNKNIIKTYKIRKTAEKNVPLGGSLVVVFNLINNI